MKGRIPIQGWQAGALVLLLGLLAGLLFAPLGLVAQNDALFFADTGHTVDDAHGFLSYWRTNEGERLLGAPVTGAVTEDGMPVQYFAYGRLEAHTELDGAPIMLGLIGSDYAGALWKQFDPPAQQDASDGQVFTATGYALQTPFLAFWESNGGLTSLGYPISAPLWEYVGDQFVQVQYFERGRLEHHPLASGTPDEVRRSTLGRDVALLRGHDTTPQAAPAVPAAVFEAAPEPVADTSAPEAAPEPVADTSAPEAAPEPVAVEAPAPVVEEVYQEPAPAVADTYAAPAPAPVYSGGGKSIVVNLSHQWLYAYEGGVQVFDAPISTGRDGFNTPPGSFAIYAKTPIQTMSGNLGGEYYSVPDVPHAMYINGDVAMHGTYWHNMFGSGVRMSHGCINLPLGSAAWIYGWAPVGTPVQVTY